MRISDLRWRPLVIDPPTAWLVATLTPDEVARLEGGRQPPVAVVAQIVDRSRPGFLGTLRRNPWTVKFWLVPELTSEACEWLRYTGHEETALSFPDYAPAAVANKLALPLLSSEALKIPLSAVAPTLESAIDGLTKDEGLINLLYLSYTEWLDYDYAKDWATIRSGRPCV